MYARTMCTRGIPLADAMQLAERTNADMETREWRGADPYDGLSSPVARLLRGTVARQLLQQTVRRSPIDLRPLLRIAPRRMAVTTGLAASAAARLAADSFWRERRDRLGRWTERGQIISGPFQGLWGYEFDVQTRWGFYAAGSPNIVATSFAAHGCLDARTLRRIQLDPLGHSLLHNLWRGRFFAYTPNSSELIHNANLLGAALAARLSGIDQLDSALRRDLWDPAGYFRATANRGRPAHRLSYPRWGAAPALDALSSLIAWDHERNAS
jgi:hypothetical protein